jgi:hypothetical protein
MIEKISITTKSNKTHIMSVEEYSRWLCLIEALELINLKAKDKKMNLDDDDSWIKPLAFQKYIKQRFPSMHHDFRVEEVLDVDYSILEDELVSLSFNNSIPEVSNSL